MTGTEVIVAALAAGAVAGSTDVAKSAVSDAYAGLKSLLRGKLAGREAAQQSLEAVETEPGRWQAMLGADLAETGADRDEQVLAAARELLNLAGVRAGKYHVDLRDAKGVQVGDVNVQHNTFG
ncbi:hypothetical protein ACIA8K_38395 [Catenuloplanes sp. NPDC051500]|uniref:hypothetical protein n=1 Tax=Catenuloplanes sp. NPDC051500 TaxID=3363959 RepID=UPI0037B94688